jgi:hypothetical protein
MSKGEAEISTATQPSARAVPWISCEMGDAFEYREDALRPQCISPGKRALWIAQAPTNTLIEIIGR